MVRSLSMLVFAIRLVLHAVRWRRRYDLIVVTTIPPVIMGVAARAVRRVTGTPYLYHCMDLYPEIAEFAGLVRSVALSTLARRLDCTTCRRAAKVIVLSEDMRQTLIMRGLDTTNIVILNNFEIEDEAERVAVSPLPKASGMFRIMFAGNMGRFQGLDCLVDAVSEISSEYPEIELLFVGAGVRSAALKEQAGPLLGRNIRFLDHQPLGAVMTLLAESQLAVVSLERDMYRVAYPSKTMMYLKSGCRLFVIVEPVSELACFVTANGLGSVCGPGDKACVLAQLRRELLREASEGERSRIRAVGARAFGRRAALDRWSDLAAEREKELADG